MALAAFASACGDSSTGNNKPASANGVNAAASNYSPASNTAMTGSVVPSAPKNIIFFYNKEAKDADKKKFENELFYGKADAKPSDQYVNGIDSIADVTLAGYSGKNVRFKADAKPEVFDQFRRAIKAMPSMKARYDNKEIEEINDLK